MKMRRFTDLFLVQPGKSGDQSIVRLILRLLDDLLLTDYVWWHLIIWKTSWIKASQKLREFFHVSEPFCQKD